MPARARSGRGARTIVATLDASKPTRQGLNIGIQQTALPLFGLGIAPVLVTQLFKVVEWHWIFATVSLPGLLIVYLLYRVLRDTPPAIAALHSSRHDASEHRRSDIFKYHNIPLNMIGMLCWLTNLIGLSALLPSYLIDYLHLSLERMGFVLSAIGFGGTVGTLFMPALSDRVGAATPRPRRSVLDVEESDRGRALRARIPIGFAENSSSYSL